MEIPNSLIAVPEWVLLVAQAIYKFTGALTVLRYTHTGSSRDGHRAANSSMKHYQQMTSLEII